MQQVCSMLVISAWMLYLGQSIVILIEKQVSMHSMEGSIVATQIFFTNSFEKGFNCETISDNGVLQTLASLPYL